ncbi:MAG: aminotransferase class III-fold pyridoxal phosphate-dependent enzyme, partial [Betaproteobacteria bacterium]|nr:aminotransferase class III-fold pyridoxal phosphate-dependent enzyme [Betaproteobacteria bacterium]
SSVIDIRNKGLMIGIELDKACAPIVDLALDAGLLLNVTAEKVVRLLPPLILDTGQINFLVTTITRIIKEFLAGSK